MNTTSAIKQDTTNTKKSLYHLSAKYLGQRVKLKALVPEDMAKSEVDFARVCAAPSIEQCIIALHEMEWFMEKKSERILCLFVYEIEDISKFEAYEDVFDFDLTGEHVSKLDSWATFKEVVHVPEWHKAGYLNLEKTHLIDIPFFRCAYEHISNEVFEKYYSEHYENCKID